MTRYSKGKYGQFKYGATVLEHPLYALEVDWDGNSLFDGANEARDQITDMSIERGREYFIAADGTTFEEQATGRFGATLLDESRRYDVYNQSSDLYGQLAAGKLFRMRVRTSTGMKDLMAGLLEEPVSFKERGMGMVRLDGNDGWAMLRDQTNLVTIPLQEGIYVDEAMALVLERAGWPRVWGSNLQAGVDQRPYYWVDSRSPAKALHELAFNELGQVNIAADGAFEFRSRLSLDTTVLTLTDDDIMSMRRLTPKEVIRNVLKVKSAPRAEGATAEVWRMGGELEVEAGAVIDDIWAEFTYNNLTVPVKTPLTPVVTTDYTGYSASGGTGTNLTSNLVVAMTAFSTRAKIRVENTGGTKAYVNLLKVRGNPLTANNTSTFEYEDRESIRQFGARPFTLTIDQNVNTARLYREILASYLVNAKNYLMVELLPEPDVQFGMDLGQIVSVQSDGYGIDGAFRVIHISHKFKDRSGIVVNTKLHLEPYVRLFTGVQLPFQLPVQLGTP
jgi:hypothetical protein